MPAYAENCSQALFRQSKATDSNRVTDRPTPASEKMRGRKCVERTVPNSQARAVQFDVGLGFDQQVRASLEALERSYALLAATAAQAGRH